MFSNTDELKNHLGFLDQSFSFEGILPDIKLASEEIRRLIGNDLYYLAIYYKQKQSSLYVSDFTMKLNELLYKIQAPIAYLAYIGYAPQNDLRHTNNGRELIAEEHHKDAKDWQIANNNEALRLKYYRTLKELFNFLFENIVAFEDVTDVQFSPIQGTNYKAVYNGRIIYFTAKESSGVEASFIDHFKSRRLSLYSRSQSYGTYNASDGTIAIPSPINDAYPMTRYFPQDQYVLDQYNIFYITGELTEGLSPFNDTDNCWLCSNNTGLLWEFSESQIFKKLSARIIRSVDEFEREHHIDRNTYLFSMLEPMMASIERIHIVPMIGHQRYNDLLQMLSTGELTEEYESLYDMIRPCIVMKTMALAVKRLSTTLLPDGILKQSKGSSSSSIISATDTARQNLSTHYDNEGDRELEALSYFIKKISSPDQPVSVVDLSKRNSPSNLFFRP